MGRCAKTLTISDREGEFSEMLKNRIFNVVVVSKNAGVELNPSEKMKSVKYSGKKLIIKLK